MTIAEYEKRGISIESLPLERLRGIDIKNVEEERIVQALVNKKLQRIPVPIVINRDSDKTDFKTIQEEQAFQKVIDARVASARPWVETEEKVEVKVDKFCNFCDALGPISHKKTCTRPEKSLTDKINALKQEKSNLE